MPPNTGDNEIVELALREDFVIVTQDLDFSAIVAQSGLTKPSVISLRVSNAKPSNISAILKSILPEIIDHLHKGAIICGRYGISSTETTGRINRSP